MIPDDDNANENSYRQTEEHLLGGKMEGLKVILRLGVFVLLILALSSGEIRGCTSFAFSHNGRPLLASNYDNDLTSGMIFVNKRGLQKNGWEPSKAGETASWAAKYGSVTFSCVGYQLAWAGMNERGLAISTMALGETVNPVPDERPPLVSPLWMQYILDTCATVEDLMHSDGKVRIMDSVDHYLVCDREGHCAAVEFLDGKMVCHTAADLPVRVLANRPYSDCIDNWKKKKELQGTPYDSQSRFNRAAAMIAAFNPAKGSAVDYAFWILDSLRPPRNPEVTRWSIVFDMANLEIHYKSYDNSNIRRIVLREFDFSCRTPAKMLDVHNKLSADISGAFRDYAHDLSLEFLLKAVLEQRPDFPREQIAPLLDLMEGYRCDSKE